MATVARCTECGSALTSGMLGNRCPRCLVQLALDTTAGGERAKVGEQKSAGGGQGLTGGPAITAEIGKRKAQIGNRFGNYELLEEIARGGMGVVWKARQQSLDRIVALKLMLSGQFAQPEFIQRFHAEAEAIAQLQHPNIVAIHEVGEHAGQPYFSMDFVAGRTLAEIVRDGPLPATRAATYLKAIAEAVQYAHQHGILHRDLKPSNVLIDASDQPRITDFGLAKRLTLDSKLQTPDLTLTGQVLGSPHYLSPEQAAGRQAEVGPASDVYALGAMLYHVVTGRPPFQADSLTTLLWQVMETEPVSPRLLNASLPRDLETICLKCLEKQASRRYASAQAVADELGRFLRTEPILARPVSRPEKVWRWCRRKPALAAALGAVVLVAAVGFVGILTQWRRAATNELAARQNAYAADMSLAQRALEKGDREETLFLLNAQRPKPDQRDLRGWEWRYLWQLCRSDQRSKEQPMSPQPTVLPIEVWSGAFAFSPDGKQFIALHFTNGAASLWETATVRQLEELSFLGTNNYAVKWSPDKRMLAVGDRRGNLRIWDYPSRSIITNFVNEGTLVGALRFAGQGRSLWCGLVVHTLGSPRTVRIWNVADWSELPLPAEATNRIIWSVVSPDNRTFASLSVEGTVTWWDLASGRQRARFKHHFANSTGFIVFSPDSQILAGSATEGFTTLWDVATGQVSTTLRGNFRAILGVAFSPDGQRLISGGKDATDVVRLMDVNSGRYVATLPGKPDGYWFVEMSADGNTLVAVGNSGTALLWHAPSLDEIEAVEKGTVAP